MLLARFGSVPQYDHWGMWESHCCSMECRIGEMALTSWKIIALYWREYRCKLTAKQKLVSSSNSLRFHRDAMIRLAFAIFGRTVSEISSFHFRDRFKDSNLDRPDRLSFLHSKSKCDQATPCFPQNLHTGFLLELKGVIKSHPLSAHTKIGSMNRGTGTCKCCKSENLDCSAIAIETLVAWPPLVAESTIASLQAWKSARRRIFLTSFTKSTCSSIVQQFTKASRPSRSSIESP